MPNIDKSKLESELKELIKTYNNIKHTTPSERDIQNNLVEKLFQLLGWETSDFEQCQREAYLTTGFVDIALSIEHKRMLFVECKRLGKIPAKAQRPRDRTREEKQAMKYAHGQKMPYAVLTNFERLHVFNADREILILSFDDPGEYLTRLEELLVLSREMVANLSLQAWEKQLEKHDVDLQFLDDLKRWRVMLAQNILDNNPNNRAILDKKKEVDFTKLLQIVQRILDRLILIAYADEKALIGKHGKIESILNHYERLSDYSTKDRTWVQYDLNRLCHQMDDKHNTTIFAKDDICEKVNVDNDTFVALMKEIEEVSFRKFTWDVLGNTYESYLGHKLELRKGKIVSDTRRELRKGKGIYYTPPRVVKYIVQQTLGHKLEELYQKHGIEAIRHVKNIKVLDPACGSGTFLVASFETLANFYKKLNQEIEAEQRIIRETKGGDLYDQRDNMKHLPDLVLDPAKRILEENLYGVDLDPEAAEYATVNLVMRAFEHRGDGNKLPLILNHNVKVGNSLVAGIHPSNPLERQSANISGLIEMRSRIGDLANSDKQKGWKDIEKLTKKIAYASNREVQKKHPKLQYNAFNWQVEFPEVFFNKDGSYRENPGFDVVIGNPPYVRQETLGEFKEFLKEHFKAYHGVADLYAYFFERGIDLLKENGLFGFISSNKFMRSNYGGPLREFIAGQAPAREIVDFGELPIFHDSSPFPAIFILEKTDSASEKLSFTPVRNKDFETVAEEVDKHAQTLSREAVSGPSWSLASDEEIGILKKMESSGTPLGEYLESQGVHIRRGVLTGFNKAFIIDRATRDALIKEDPKSEEIIKPLIVGDDVRRYHINYRDCYLIWTYKGVDIKKYPAVLKHLKKYKKELEKRWDKGDYWYELRACDYYDDFLKPKIVYPDIGMECRFAMEKTKVFVEATAFSLPMENWGLLGVLNSKAAFFYFKGICPVLGDVDERGRLRFKTVYLKNFPVPNIEDQRSQSLSEVVQRITDLNNGISLALYLLTIHVNNYSPYWAEFEEYYWLEGAYSSLVKKKMLIDSNLEGEVTAIKVREEGQNLRLSATIDDSDLDVAQIAIEDEDFRLFLYYSIRSFLDKHSGKRKWGEGRVAQTVLRSLRVPFFRPKALDDPKLNLEQIKLLMKEFRAEAPLLHITEAEDEIVRSEQEIDDIVYKLYGLTKKEIAIVESKVS